MPGVGSMGTIFPFTFMYTEYVHYIHPPSIFPHLFPPSTGTNPSDSACFTLLFSDFVKEK
jgi:hypothetical protein